MVQDLKVLLTDGELKPPSGLAGCGGLVWDDVAVDHWFF